MQEGNGYAIKRRLAGALALIVAGAVLGAWLSAGRLLDAIASQRADWQVARGERAILEASAAAVRADTLAATVIPMLALVALSFALVAVVVMFLYALQAQRERKP